MGDLAWPVVQLAEIAELDIERVLVERNASYAIAGVLNAGQGLFSRETIIGRETTYKALNRLRAGRLVYRKLTAWEGPITVVPSEFDGAFVSSEFPTFALDDTRVEPAFLKLVCQRPSFWQEMRLRSAGTAERRNRLKPDELLQVEIAVPPLAEQRRIISALRTVDGALDAAQAVRVEAESFLRALREIRLVEDGDWRTAEKWETATLSDVTDVRLGFTKGRKLIGPTRTVPYLRAVNVQDGFIALDDVAEIEAVDSDVERWALQPDDVLLLEGCGSPRLVGRGWIWDGSIEPCLHQNSTLRARVLDSDRLNPQFLAHALCSSPARRHCFESMEQMSVAHLGLAGARAIPIPIPPIAEQRAIVDEFEQARALLVAAERKAQQYQVTRLQILDALLSGDQRADDSLSSVEELATA
jgi:type I restriction enzyme, S subunit